MKTCINQYCNNTLIKHELEGKSVCARTRRCGGIPFEDLPRDLKTTMVIPVGVLYLPTEQYRTVSPLATVVPFLKGEHLKV